MLFFMQHFEVHLLETESDIDLALQSGLLTVDQLDNAECADCGNAVGHSAGNFESFAVVIDEFDQDWATCSDCASSIVEGTSNFSSSDSLEFLAVLEHLDEDDIEKF